MLRTDHERYDRDERRLLETASDELWSDCLVDGVVDVAAEVLEGASWSGVSESAAPRTAERLTATLALGAMGVRTTRTAALTIRAGYAPEALADVRVLMETAGHARRVLDDASGQYAENWLRGRGRADSPRVAFGPDPDDAPVWKLMSDLSHAVFAGHVDAFATLDEERRIIHCVGPSRDPVMDSLWLWVIARRFAQLLACVLKVHPHIDDAGFLAAAAPIFAAEARVNAEIASRLAS